ncbi:phosphatase PAP2 family protein [Rhodocytophaga rosea]|uniref:Phosphatase PAP2 family protein n=1 Tax=Rhodocytophaga rosea TaxID=2704465 RepID=A0A6C0GE47_9BACT|nr:phosphatase PAP2 family protein [Rhodocytophaga rosea]QHT66279.1 phosphatase PAP2 family protein [Rhodocytophaga rosea]
MKKSLLILITILSIAMHVQAQIEPSAGSWKTWFIESGKAYRLPPPASYKSEITQVLARQQNLDSAGMQQILFWNAGSPGYRWQQLMADLWMSDTTTRGVLANMLLGTATYDATIAAWDTKYTYNRPRPFAADGHIQTLVQKPDSPSYPCEHSVAAGVATTIISHFFPALADSVTRMAQQAINSRIAAGTAFPSDTKAGFELGKRIAQHEIERTKNFIPNSVWNGKIPEGPGLWKGKNPMFPQAGLNKTVVLSNASQFRPGPPPDFAKEMEEMKNYKQTFRSKANAFYYASHFASDDLLSKKIFEYNLHLNPPMAARIYAINSVATYDGFVACWDAKYAYWGIRPDQYDTTYQALMPAPPFPGYPSGHAMMCGVVGELYSFFFPAEKAYFQKIAKDGAESRFQAGIHFRSDNEAGLELGKKVANAVIRKVQADGAGNILTNTNQKRVGAQAKK